MAGYSNAYSRFVMGAKIVLPLMALGLLSTLFLLARDTDREVALPYSEAEIETLTEGSRITNPSFAGVNLDGTSLIVAAGIASEDPDIPGRVVIEDMQAEIRTPANVEILMGSDRGTYSRTDGRSVLSGNVHAVTSTGYAISADRLVAVTERSLLRSEGPVRAEGPLGSIEAGEMEIVRTPGAQGGYVLVFNGGVKLLYLPKDLGPEN